MEATRQEMEEKIVGKALSDATFKQELLSSPKAAVEKELGITIPEGVAINVVQETGEQVFLVLPYIEAEGELSEDQLETVAGGRRISYGVSF